jgi:hypothetical protein
MQNGNRFISLTFVTHCSQQPIKTAFSSPLSQVDPLASSYSPRCDRRDFGGNVARFRCIKAVRAWYDLR